MRSLIIREATSNDLEDLATLLVAFSDVHARALPHIYQPVMADAETATYLRRVMALAQTHLFVAEFEGQVVGMLILQRDETPHTPVHVPRQWAMIPVIVVRETVRQQGIGTAARRAQGTMSDARAPGIVSGSPMPISMAGPPFRAYRKALRRYVVPDMVWHTQRWLVKREETFRRMLSSGGAIEP